MSNTPNFTLDDIRAAAEKKYGNFKVEIGGGEVVELRNALRLAKDERKELNRLQSDLDQDGEDEDADQGDSMAKVLRLVASDTKQADKLIAAIGDDLTVLAELFSQYVEATQPGEASGSQD